MVKLEDKVIYNQAWVYVGIKLIDCNLDSSD